MKDRIFLDTNILVYAHTDLDLAKQSVAQQLVINRHSVISTQVIQELANTLHRKFKHLWKDIVDVLEDVVQNNSYTLIASKPSSTDAGWPKATNSLFTTAL